MHESFLTLMQGRGGVEPDEEVLEDGIAFAGVAKFPARVKCALLSWMAWKDATSQIVAAGRSSPNQQGDHDRRPHTPDHSDLPEVDTSGTTHRR